MRNGIELVEILDEFLKIKKISRRQFAALVDIPNSTIATWKSKNILPSVELLAKIATFMNVSLDWLVNGDLMEDATKENKKGNLYSLSGKDENFFRLYKKYYSLVNLFEKLTKENKCIIKKLMQNLIT